MNVGNSVPRREENKITLIKKTYLHEVLSFTKLWGSVTDLIRFLKLTDSFYLYRPPDLLPYYRLNREEIPQNLIWYTRSIALYCLTIQVKARRD